MQRMHETFGIVSR